MTVSYTHLDVYKRQIQNRERFCFGLDAVLLTGFAKVGKGEKALDIGTGTGIIPILLEAKTEGQDFEALEIQPESAEMARRSVMPVSYTHLDGYKRQISPSEWRNK